MGLVFIILLFFLCSMFYGAAEPSNRAPYPQASKPITCGRCYRGEDKDSIFRNRLYSPRYKRTATAKQVYVVPYYMYRQYQNYEQARLFIKMKVNSSIKNNLQDPIQIQPIQIQPSKLVTFLSTLVHIVFDVRVQYQTTNPSRNQPLHLGHCPSYSCQSRTIILINFSHTPCVARRARSSDYAHLVPLALLLATPVLPLYKGVLDGCCAWL